MLYILYVYILYLIYYNFLIIVKSNLYTVLKFGVRPVKELDRWTTINYTPHIVSHLAVTVIFNSHSFY